MSALSHDDYLALVEKLQQLNDEYYNNNQSSVPDHKYDAWYQQVKQYEANNPLLAVEHSPTQIVGTEPQ